MTNIITQPSPKAKQFLEELNTLLAKYQYTMTPELQFGKNGVVPVMSLNDVIPTKENVTAKEVKPTPEMVAEAKKKYQEKHGTTGGNAVGGGLEKGTN